MQPKFELKIISAALLIALVTAGIYYAPAARIAAAADNKLAAQLACNKTDPTEPSASYLARMQAAQIKQASAVKPTNKLNHRSGKTNQHQSLQRNNRRPRPNSIIVASTVPKYNDLASNSTILKNINDPAHRILSKIQVKKRHTSILWTRSGKTYVEGGRRQVKPTLAAKASNRIWHRLRNNFCLNLAKDNAQVKLHAAKYKRQHRYLEKFTNNASPYIADIMQKLEERNMPGELALLPMIESSFNPNATSHMGATGLWQLAASTGKRYGLIQRGWQDPRKNVSAATNAALSYLQFLHNEFDGDWFLAIAAYNAGEGRVRRAIKRNLAQNKPTDFWSLPLPKETQNYVPKLLALASLIKHADINQMKLAELKINNVYPVADITRLAQTVNRGSRRSGVSS